MKRSRHILWLGVVALGLGGGAIPSAGHADEMPCTTEIRTYCAEVQPGGGRLLQCLKTNESKLTPSCVNRVNELQQAASGPLSACRDDWVSYCYHPRASTERGAMIQCLQTHEEQLSSPCQKALKGAGGKQRQRSSGVTP